MNEICTNCGAPVSGASPFCMSCGERVESETEGTKPHAASDEGASSQDPDETATAAVRAVSFRCGELTPEESSKVHGAVYARILTDPYSQIDMEQVDRLAGVINTLRNNPCQFCKQEIASHTLEIDRYETYVWCDKGARKRTYAQWLAGPKEASAGSILGGTLLWMGIPFFSFGMLSWVPAAIGAVGAKVRLWGVAAVLMGASILSALALSNTEKDSPAYNVGAVLLLANWIGGTVFGAFQVKRWATRG